MIAHAFGKKRHFFTSAVRGQVRQFVQSVRTAPIRSTNEGEHIVSDAFIHMPSELILIAQLFGKEPFHGLPLAIQALRAGRLFARPALFTRLRSSVGHFGELHFFRLWQTSSMLWPHVGCSEASQLSKNLHER